MPDEPVTTELWPEPRVTPNAIMLCGYLTAAVSGEMYKPLAVESVEASVVVAHRKTGNRYRVTVVQISGKE